MRSVQFLAEKIKSDGEWAIIVDQLNESLHEDSLTRIKPTGFPLFFNGIG